MSPAAPWFRWLTILIVAGSILFLLNRGLDRSFWTRGGAPKAYTDLTLTGVAKSYPQALAQFDAQQAAADERTASMPGDWLMHNVSARAWLARARLTGSYDDFLRADQAVDQAFRVAAPGTGPHMTGAVVAFTMHRLGRAEEFLSAIDRYAVPPDKDEQAEIAAMRGDIAFYRGQYAEALAAYDGADRLMPGATDLRRAIYHGNTGRPDLAALYLDRAEQGLQNRTPLARAKIELQRGVLDFDRNRIDDAFAHFRSADRLFRGHWQIEERLAEVLMLRGDLTSAQRIYSAIAERTSQPEAMDALAAIASATGNRDERQAWSDRAEAIWRARIRQFPEAAYGHAIDHCVATGDRACALTLARRNAEARPHGEAQIKLARALFASGRKSEALQLIETVLASRWRTFDLHRAAAAIYAGAGRSAEAAEQNGLARQLSDATFGKTSTREN